MCLANVPERDTASFLIDSLILHNLISMPFSEINTINRGVSILSIILKIYSYNLLFYISLNSARSSEHDSHRTPLLYLYTNHFFAQNKNNRYSFNGISNLLIARSHDAASSDLLYSSANF